MTMESIGEIAARIVDRFAWHRAALAGEKPPIHEGEPRCGYFKVRDRRGLNRNKAAIKRPFIACAIWFEDGVLKAELAGAPTDVDRLWPYCARYPIPYETYAFWHEHERWPDEQKDAAA